MKHINMTHVSNRKFGCMKGYEFDGDYNTSKSDVGICNMFVQCSKVYVSKLEPKEAKEANLHVSHLVEESFKGNKM